MEVKTYRFRGHFEGDPNLGERYRTKKEMAQWMAKCPIKRFKDRILKGKLASKKELDKMENDVRQQVEDAMAYANASPFPAGEEALEDVFA